MIVLPPTIKEFLRKFTDNGLRIYVVGGSVRDLLLKQPIENWDFATNATPDKILKLFPDSFYNNQFGTVGIPFRFDNHDTVFEVTTFRREGEYKDMRHPQTVE